MAHSQYLIKRPLTLKGSLALLGSALFAGSLAAIPVFGQNRSNTPYCFVVKDELRVFSRPSAGAATDDAFNENDIAYATANPPRTVISGGRAFVEVAIYGGNKAWLPRTSTIDGVPLIVDLTPNQCINPGAGAVGFGGIGGGDQPTGILPQDNSTPYCFVVQTTTPLSSNPSRRTRTNDRYAIGDIAYATSNPPTTVMSEGIPYVEVAIYGGNKAWAPRQLDDADLPALVDLTTNQCTNPGRGAAGFDGSF